MRSRSKTLKYLKSILRSLERATNVGIIKRSKKIKITFVKKIRCDTKSRHQKVGITIKNQKIKNKRIEGIKCQHIGGSFLAIEISIEKKVERCHKGQTDII